jgi:hypothetical protein
MRPHCEPVEQRRRKPVQESEPGVNLEWPPAVWCRQVAHTGSLQDTANLGEVAIRICNVVDDVIRYYDVKGAVGERQALVSRQERASAGEA